MDFQIITNIIAILSLLAMLYQAFRVLSGYEAAIKEIQHELEIHEMVSNQLRERLEHVTKRLQQQSETTQSKLERVANYLRKNTPYDD